MTINTNIKDKEELYYKIFGLMNIIHGIKFFFTKAEKTLISKLYSKRDDLVSKGVSNKDIQIILFSSETRISIMSEMEISKARYHNIILALRKKRMIIGNELNPFYPHLMHHSLEDGYSFTVNFKKIPDVE